MPKSKLTPEEKKALQVEKKAEKKRQQIELKKQIAREQLGREIRYGELTLKKHEKEWKSMLMEIALPKMRDDMEFAWHNFEGVMDCKDFTISLLMDELRDAEEQYMMNISNHVEHVDSLIDTFHERLEELKMYNEEQINKLERKNEQQIEALADTSTEDENYLKTMLYMIEIAEKQEEQNIKTEHFAKTEEEDFKNNQVVQRMKGVLESTLQTLWLDTTTFLEMYVNKVRDRKNEHDKLKKQDDSQQKLLSKQLEQLRKMYDTINRLKLKQSENVKFLGRKHKDLESEFEFLNFAFNKLKIQLEKDRKLDFQKLKILTVNYNETIKHLSKLQEKGEHILHVATVCRKMETQEEKIMPFPAYITVNLEDHKDYIDQMDLFWQRVAQVDASRYAINEEREFLKNEYKILKQKLHQYCQCLNCPAYKDVYVGRGRYVTEGALEQQKYEKHKSLQFDSDHTFPYEGMSNSSFI